MHTHFDPDQHLVSLVGDPVDRVSDGGGGFLDGIWGRAGAASTTDTGMPVGVDFIRMAPGQAFQLHSHPGAHILVVQGGAGKIEIDATSYALRQGDSIFVPAKLPHAVSAHSTSGLEFLAFGVPHVPMDASHRMELRGEGAMESPC